jgi:aldehyde dehydrogenase (NAD+)
MPSPESPAVQPSSRPATSLPPIDRTPKLYIGGKQARPDGGYSLPVLDAAGNQVAAVGRGNRKDIRNAVEAAHRAAAGWSKATAHTRAQVLYYFAENLAAREREFAERLGVLTGGAPAGSAGEVAAAIQRAFSYAAWADKYDGRVHATPFRNVTLAMNEPIGVLGLVCPVEAPLLGFLSLALPAVAMGNTVVAVPSERWPLPATDLYQVLDTSDVPGGVINIVTGTRKELAPVLAAHDDVDGVWFYGPRQEAAEVERLSAGNMKRTRVEWEAVDWLDDRAGQGEEFLREATQVKNIWVPYGA